MQMSGSSSVVEAVATDSNTLVVGSNLYPASIF